MNTYAAMMLLALGAPAPVHDRLPAQKLWLYPCDVHLPNVCFRLPSEMNLTYEVPADFGLYRVKGLNSTDAITIYSGLAPDRSRLSGKPSFKITSSSHDLYGFVTVSGKNESLDILITAKGARTVTHLYVKLTPDGQRAIARVVSGLRPCVRRSRETLMCPARSPWGEDLLTWVQSVTNDVGTVGVGGS